MVRFFMFMVLVWSSLSVANTCEFKAQEKGEKCIAHCEKVNAEDLDKMFDCRESCEAKQEKAELACSVKKGVM
jgi:hypothetical protein